MLLHEAKELIDDRIENCDFKEEIPDYIEALELASRCIEQQMRLCDMLSSFWDDVSEDDSFSASLTHGILLQYSIYAKFDEDGMLIDEEDGNGEHNDSN